ncbi:MAG: hypothetical protein QXT93_10800 [Thermofilum sp.]
MLRMRVGLLLVLMGSTRGGRISYWRLRGVVRPGFSAGALGGGVVLLGGW